MKTYIKYTLAVLALLISTLATQAQVKIGNNPTSINGGSLLELESTNKGLLMPRISLTNTTTWGLSGTAAAGMHVYNTNPAITSTTATCPTLVAKIGEYYWDGTCWVALAPVGTQDSPIQFSVKKSSANQLLPLSTYVLANFNAADYDKNSNFNLATDSFTVPADGAGYYQINGNFTSVLTTAPQGAYLVLFINGVFKRNLAVGNTGGNAGIGAGGSIAVRLNAGDVVDFRMTSTVVNTTTVSTLQVDVYLISR